VSQNPALHTQPTTSKVRQGYLEGSNSSTVMEMANLMTAMRGFEANQHVIQIQDDRLAKPSNWAAQPDLIYGALTLFIGGGHGIPANEPGRDRQQPGERQHDRFQEEQDRISGFALRNHARARRDGGRQPNCPRVCKSAAARGRWRRRRFSRRAN
jgi:hypothetical protein